MTGRRPPALDLAGYVLALMATLVGLHLLDAGALAAPPLLAGAGDLRRWLEARDSAAALFALIRLCAVILTCYLLVTTLAALALRIIGAARAASLLDAISLPAARRLVQAMAGVSFAASAVGVVGALTAPGAAGAAIRRASSEQVVSMHSLPEDEVVMRRLPDLPDLPDLHSARAPASSSWTIRPGDHFWRVAEEVLTSAWGRRARGPEITTYWRQLVEANRGRLVDANNDDLLIPGQVIELPAPPPAPG